MSTLQHLMTAFDVPKLGGAVLAFFLLGAAPVAAQEVTVEANPTAGESSEGGKLRNLFSGLSSFASIDMGIGPDMKPRRSLRIRFDSATRAMRSLGVDAQECATVVRSIRPAGDVGRLGVSVGLNCRFF